MTIERTPTSDGRHITYRLPGNVKFDLENLESPHADALSAFETSVEVFAATRVKADTIATDARLSPVGRSEMLAPVHGEAISQLAGAWWHVVSHLEPKIQSQEEALLKVPDIEPGHTVCAIEDAEVRGFFRSLSGPERMSMIAQMESDPAKHERVQIAMLRSPIALLDQEATLLRKLWVDARRAGNPIEAAAIDHGRRSAEWARRGLLTLGALFKTTTEIDSRDLLRKVLLDGNPRRATGYGVFGFNQVQAANEERILSNALGYFKNAEGVWRKAA